MHSRFHTKAAKFHMQKCPLLLLWVGRFNIGDVVAENIGKWLPRLKEKHHLKNIAFAMDCRPDFEVLFMQDRQKTIKLLLEASMLFTGTYATTAAILQGPPPDPEPTAGQPD
jgi:hypothetical protein